MRTWSGWAALSTIVFIGGCFSGIPNGAENQAEPPPECVEYDVDYVFASKQALDKMDATTENFTSNIWSVRPNGMGLKPLTDLNAEYADSVDPVTSPDGKRIAYVSRRHPNGKNAPTPFLGTNIWIMNHDGSGNRPLTRLKSMYTDSIQPVFSPDGSRVYYISRRPLSGVDEGDAMTPYNLWSVGVDGSDDRPVTRLKSNGAHVSHARFSPDGNRIYYVSERALDGSDAPEENRSGNIWVMNADGSGSRPLTRFTDGTHANGFSLSPDGSRIAFRSDARPVKRGPDEDHSAAEGEKFPFNIWIMKSDGKGARPLSRLTARGADSMAPVFSPDGRYVVYSSWRDENGADGAVWSSSRNLWRVNIDGTGETPLSRFDNDIELVSPVFSLDQGGLIFVSNRRLDDGAGVHSATNLWEMRVDDFVMTDAGETPRTEPLTKGSAYAMDITAPVVSAKCTRWDRAMINHEGN